MVVTCDHCGARYRFDEDRISGRGARITCPRCRHVFVVHNEVPEAVEEAQEPQKPLDVHKLDFAGVGIRSWKVKVAIGLVYDFSDYKTLRKYIKEGRVTESDNLSYDNENWVEIGSLPDLKQYFVDVYMRAESAQVAAQIAAAAAEEAAAHPTEEEAEAIADALLESMETEPETPDVEMTEDDEESEEAPDPESDADPESAPEPESDAEAEAAPEVPQTAEEIGDDLLAAMDAAVAAEEGGVDLDMDALLAESEADESSEPVRRGLETAALAQVQATGNAEAQGHQFVDPFETLKQKRQARSKSKKAGGKKARAASAEQQSKAKQKVLMVAVLLAVFGYLVYDNMDDAPQNTSQSVAQVTQDPSLKAREVKRAEEYRKERMAELNKKGTPVDEEAAAWEVEDEPLIPVGPAKASQGPARGIAGQLPPSQPSASVGQIEQRDSTTADHMAMARRLAGQGNWSQAAEAYGMALRSRPGNTAEIRALRGEALYLSGRSDEAERDLKLAAQGGAVTAHKILGHLKAKQGDISEALAQYQRYLNSRPGDKAEIEKIIQNLQNQGG